jgi:hypothetical protein
MRFYKGSLTRRLILDISIDNELEESIVIQLRVSKINFILIYFVKHDLKGVLKYIWVGIWTPPPHLP